MTDFSNVTCCGIGGHFGIESNKSWPYPPYQKNSITLNGKIMKLIMTLLVRDEEDVLRENILYHIEQGVDYFIATDNLSVDNTSDILKDFQSKGILHLIEEKSDDYFQKRWVSRMAQLAKNVFNADWVVNSDADEFWWSEKGTLKGALCEIPDSYSVVRVNRHDFVPLVEEGGVVFERMVYRYKVTLNSSGHPLLPKVCHRGMGNVEVSQGNHDVKHPPDLESFSNHPLGIFHFPKRTYDQFENKVVKGGAAYERNKHFSHQVGHSWREYYKRWKEGKLRKIYNSDSWTYDRIVQGLDAGILVEDRRLLSFMRDNNIIQA